MFQLKNLFPSRLMGIFSFSKAFNPLLVVARQKMSQCQPHNTEKRASVYISSSNDIFYNLALEDWLYQNYDFKDESLLLLWSNTPCVVIGRHQNPWTEVNIKQLIQNNIQLSRRNSGGGTVYHDLGNLNCTFFSCRSRYNRKANLELICHTLRDKWNANVTLSAREDILLNEVYKISGTASKLGHKNCYHHCTLLVDVDSSKLVRILSPNWLHLHNFLTRINSIASCDRTIAKEFKFKNDLIVCPVWVRINHRCLPLDSLFQLGIESSATASVRSPVLNLVNCHPDINIHRLREVIAQKYLETRGIATTFERFKIVNPTERDFPGIENIKNELSSWDWIYGKTPRFTVRWPLKNGRSQLELQVYRGLIEKTNLAPIGIEEVDSRFWSTLLANHNLDRKLFSKLYHCRNFDHLSDEDPNVLLKSFILDLCSITI